MKRYAVIVAGGSGTRMGAHKPKQFLSLKGKPILAHTLEKFHQADASIELILVLPDTGVHYWETFVDDHNFSVPHKVTLGGKTRTESVSKGLMDVPYGALVAIHDAVRPFVSTQIILNSYSIAEDQGAAVATTPLKDSILRKTNRGYVAANREDYLLVQTPQTFQSTIIKEAYQLLEAAQVSDDATVAELAGNTITFFEGSPENIKITTPIDLVLGEAILMNQKTN